MIATTFSCWPIVLQQLAKLGAGFALRKHSLGNQGRAPFCSSHHCFQVCPVTSCSFFCSIWTQRPSTLLPRLLMRSSYINVRSNVSPRRHARVATPENSSQRIGNRSSHLARAREWLKRLLVFFHSRTHTSPDVGFLRMPACIAAAFTDSSPRSIASSSSGLSRASLRRV